MKLSWFTWALWCALAACTPNTDLTVPPPKVSAKFDADVPPAADTGRLPAWEEPTHYRLALDINPRADRFSGKVEIDVKLAQPSAVFVLHAAELSIESAEVVADERWPLKWASRPAAGATKDAEELVLIAPRELSGDVSLHIEYVGPLTESLRGMYRVREGDADFVFTQFEASHARRMLPCFDDPIYKVPFDVRITAPKQDAVFSNMPETEQKPVEGGDKVQHVFATSPRMPTYLLALAIGPLEAREGSKEPVPIRVIARKGMASQTALALDVAKAHLDILTDYFGSPYPYAKLDLVAVPSFAGGAMENAGLITFAEEYLLMDEKAPASSQRDMALTVAHEIAHHWFGNLVTMKWWDDLWLNEGFATYAETLVVHRWRPEMRPELELLGWIGWVMDVDALASARAVRQPVLNTYQAEEAFDGITYVKGAAVIRMLHRWLGDEAFRAGLRSYMERHAWGNANADDLFQALQQSSAKQVGDVASSFLDQPGVPLVDVAMTCERGKAPRVALEQRRYRGTAAPVDEALWKIPVCLAWPRSQGRGQKIERTCTLLEERRTQIELATEGCPKWLLPNADYHGYYRYRLDGAALAELASVSKSLGVTEKVGLLTNLWALVQSGAASSETLVDVLLDYKREPEREVIDELIAILSHMNDALVTPASRPDFERLVTALLLPVAQKVGFEARPNDSEDIRLLRGSVLAALVELTTDPWLRAEAQKRVAPWLADPSKVDADAAAIALKVAARTGEVRFADLEKRLEDSDPARRVAVVEALGSFADRNELNRTLSALTSGKIKAQDARYVARAAETWPDTRAVFLEWLKDNLVPLGDKLPGFGVFRFVAPIGRLCEQGARDKAETVFKPLIVQVGGSDRRLREAVEAADLCIDLRGRQAPALGKYLAKKRF